MELLIFQGGGLSGQACGPLQTMVHAASLGQYVVQSPLCHPHTYMHKHTCCQCTG